MLIRAADSVLVIIDMQERLVPAMQAPARTIRNARTLMACAQEMGVPMVMTEQYPAGLGQTVPELKPAPGTAVLSKMHFSCMEAAASLIEEGYEVFVVSDATASRTLESEQACIARLSAAGAGIATTEMVAFEWLGRAGTAAFKKLLPLIK